MSSLGAAWNALLTMITRATISLAQPGTQRPALTVQALEGEVFSGVPLMLPYGYSAVPNGGDVLVLLAGSSRDQKIALCADNPALRITDLGGGDLGISDGRGQRIVLRSDRLEVTTSLKLVVNAASDITITSATTVTLSAPAVHVGGAGGRRLVLDGDPVSGGTVHATSTNAWGL